MKWFGSVCYAMGIVIALGVVVSIYAQTNIRTYSGCCKGNPTGTFSWWKDIQYYPHPPNPENLWWLATFVTEYTTYDCDVLPPTYEGKTCTETWSQYATRSYETWDYYTFDLQGNATFAGGPLSIFNQAYGVWQCYDDLWCY